ncbi:STAS domain-containing protein [Algibacter pectinivorans]|uniref:STAS domain-containing protein n=1 Tax=Algibacter pectinivorans TaxID=870482 RepID=A0A1I1P3I8_9FLAO|nr:STAS domain-containing protein [Algibacter pectinivorans]SFD04514.1 STAS domain-containing protein [Algibacter pectinivorans]
MSLNIKENNGVFLLEGIVNTATSKKFKDRLEFLLTYTKSVTINIEKVSAIDNHGLHVIQELFQIAKTKNKSFSVIGYGCKTIYQTVEIPFRA